MGTFKNERFIVREMTLTKKKTTKSPFRNAITKGVAVMQSQGSFAQMDVVLTEFAWKSVPVRIRNIDKNVVTQTIWIIQSNKKWRIYFGTLFGLCFGLEQKVFVAQVSCVFAANKTSKRRIQVKSPRQEPCSKIIFKSGHRKQFKGSKISNSSRPRWRNNPNTGLLQRVYRSMRHLKA